MRVKLAVAGSLAALLLGLVPEAVCAAPAPGDRVYAAEQFSNTVSVTDPVANRLLGVIRLGDPQPGNFSPLYRGQVLVHGLGFSPDHRTLAVVAIGSNGVSFIDTATNTVKHTTYVGRSPHEAFYTPDGAAFAQCRLVANFSDMYTSLVDLSGAGNRDGFARSRQAKKQGNSERVFAPRFSSRFRCACTRRSRQFRAGANRPRGAPEPHRFDCLRRRGSRRFAGEFRRRLSALPER